VYIWKLVIKYADGYVKSDWVCPSAGESIKQTQKRVDQIVDKLEADPTIMSVHLTRRTMPGI